jgi:hypothetical protein
MSGAQSPLFEPVLWRGRGFKILDEIQVPEKIEYIQVTEVAQALDAVRNMKTRAFGQVLTYLYSGALTAQDYPGGDAAMLGHSLAQMTEQFAPRGRLSIFGDWVLTSKNGVKRRRAMLAPVKPLRARRASLANR